MLCNNKLLTRAQSRVLASRAFILHSINEERDGNMAEAAVVSALIDQFTSMVFHKLSQEVSLIVNFREDFEFFRDQLLSIKCLLADAGEKRNSSNSSLVSNWLDNLEDFVSEAEYQVVQWEAIDHNIFTKLIFRFPMGKKIKELRKRLQQIQQNAQNLNLLRSALDLTAHRQASDADHRYKEKRGRSNALLQESQIVGMDDDIQVITDWILKKGSRKPVIAIVGMGGQGKTLLLQHIFNSEEVQKHFDCQIWLAISEKFIVIELLREVVKQFEQSERVKQFDGNDENVKKKAHLPNEKELKHLSEEELREKIHKHLDQKSCLFAVDDVWDRDAWEKIGLPSRLQDKVVVTTRDEKVAKAMGTGDQILHKNSLSEENSWQLFCLHAFPDGAHHCPEALDKIAHQIVSKCGGLPLAIKTIGAYLARLVRGLPNDWEWTLLHLSEAYAMSDRVMPSLKLSYEALPAHLKPCFHYCSVFPKNTEIESEYLVHAWIAQGFVSAQLQEEVYDVGCSYLEELIDRCLIEVSEVGGNERLQSCKMHDLLHDLAVSEQTRCLVKPGGQLQRIPEDCQGLRRISLMKNEISTINNGIGCPGLRSLLLSHNNFYSISASFFDNMRYLSVLDLSHTRILSLPDSIGNLKLLKYLNISGTRITELPQSLSRLRHLQFLDVSDSNVRRLHPGIDQHKHMLHLNLDSTWLADYPVGISKLIYLQTLKGVRFTDGNAAASANALQLRDLKGLTHLQHLSLSLYHFDATLYHFDATDEYNTYQMEDEGTFRGMTKMRTLYVRRSVLYGFPPLRLPNDMEAMERLEIVHLENCVVPKWIFQLQNLMELRLDGSFNSSSADLTGLEKIPHLKKLHLIRNGGENFTEFPNEFGEAGAFLRLEELLIECYPSLKKIPSFQEDAMPMLKCVRIKQCSPLENVPEGLTKLKNLKEVEVEMVVGDVENFEYDKRHCWQSFKDQQIKIKVEISDGFELRRLL